MTLQHNRSTDSYSLMTRITLVLFALTLTAGCASEAGKDSESSGSNSTGIPVEADTVRTETLEETLTAIGTLRADQTVQITPEIAAPIEKILFEEGSTVKKGELMIQLDEDKLREQYQARKHSLDEAQAQFENAERTYERNKKLHRKDMIPTQQLDDSREAYKSAEARVGRIKSQMQEAGERLDDASIHAPFTGYAGSREVDAGNYVQPGTHLTTLYRLNPLEVRFTVAERFLGRVRSGQSIELHVSAYPETSFPGEIYFVSPSVREQTRDILVKARVENPERKLKPGAFARVQVVVDTLKERPVIPARALISTRGGYRVFKIVDGKAVGQSVKIGLRQPGRVEIRSGLTPGETIISSGHMTVADGKSVQVTNGEE